MLTALLVTQLAASLVLGDRAEVRGRFLSGADPTCDLVDTPSATLQLATRRWSSSLTYAPVLTLASVELGGSPQVLHVASASGTWRWSRRVELTLSESAMYGLENFSYLTGQATTAGQPPPPLQLLPSGETISYAGSRTLLLASLHLTPRVRSTMWVGYQLSGGTDAGARAVVPFQYGPVAQAQLAWAVSRRDTFLTTATGAKTDFLAGPCQQLPGRPPPDLMAVCAPSDELASLASGWRRRLDRHIDLTLSAGAVVTASRLATEPYREQAYPTLEALLSRHVEEGRERELRGEVLFRLAPVVDARTGLIDQRAELLATGSLSVGRARVTALLGMVQSVPVEDPGAATFLRGDIELGYRLITPLEVSGGARAAWQTQDPFGTFFTGTLFVALALRSAPLRF